MFSTHVSLGGGYTVSVGPGLLEDSGAITAALLPPCKAAVICGSNVAPLYLPSVVRSFSAAGFRTVSTVYPAGESSKNISTLSGLLEFLADSGMTRGDLVVALGGGVTGDLAGFAAGVYLRGVSYIQLPTTLLAAVDSSVGGKTGIDLAAGKNLAGLFIQPRAVICDTDALSTLTPEAFSCGAAEVIKTAILSGPALFSLLEDGGMDKALERVISLCVEYKASVVEADEFERGQRRLLNLGHTAAHAIELLSGFSQPHGLAVAAGTAIITRASCRLGLCAPAVCRRILSLLEAHGLPLTAPFSAEALSRAALSDKKRRGDAISLIFPQDIGRCIIKNTPISELSGVFSLGLE